MMQNIETEPTAAPAAKRPREKNSCTNSGAVTRRSRASSPAKQTAASATGPSAASGALAIRGKA
ncbi:MAG: hypothetical protein QOH05_2255 [Acetobacteraceae bacterium]|nr:hypothetical protein [Acetobacteraceae bacterium]